jgi:hypothetical protein
MPRTPQLTTNFHHEIATWSLHSNYIVMTSHSDLIQTAQTGQSAGGQWSDMVRASPQLVSGGHRVAIDSVDVDK